MANCPHCSANIKGMALLGASYWRPFVCLECAKASRVTRPSIQNFLIVALGMSLGYLCIYFLPFPGNVAAILATCPLLVAVDAALLARTAQLRPVLPRNPAYSQ